MDSVDKALSDAKAAVAERETMWTDLEAERPN